jgi:hypothetical protein
MKTVLDAVNELKGELKEGTRLIICDGRGVYESCLYQIVNDFYKFVCTREQFNDLVSQMKTNFGKCSAINVSDYKICTKQLLTKSDKELEVMDIDWSKAPEWATEYAKLKNKDWYYYINDKCYAFLTNLDDVYEYGNSDESTEYFVRRDFEILEERPIPCKPVFTQEMCDNGYCPKLGAKFIVGNVSDDSRIIDFRTLEVEVIGLSVTDRHKQVITFSHPTMGIGCGVFNESWVEPLTPPIELTDKGLYLFDINHKTKLVGEAYFTEIGDCWMITNLRTNTSYHASKCTNIQPLTVEGK